MTPVNCPAIGVALIRVAQPRAAVRQAAADPDSRRVSPGAARCRPPIDVSQPMATRRHREGASRGRSGHPSATIGGASASPSLRRRVDRRHHLPGSAHRPLRQVLGLSPRCRDVCTPAPTENIDQTDKGALLDANPHPGRPLQSTRAASQTPGQSEATKMNRTYQSCSCAPNVLPLSRERRSRRSRLSPTHARRSSAAAAC
jgi:hypothetical protein